MFTTVDPAGLRADLQLVSGVQSEGKLYEWLSMVQRSGRRSPAVGESVALRTIWPSR